MDNDSSVPTIPGSAGSLPPPFDQVESHLGRVVVIAVDQAVARATDNWDAKLQTMRIQLQTMQTQLKNELTVAINDAVPRGQENSEPQYRVSK
ncbi:hypothetical protein FVEG_15508 [Fusarium verticillioides 7600]|uniref:Uncharacterized protein n=1 Tax=Gibberella moniliformis (strain M3125 / FGSC 7600) TaxID=334819 RepID=W7MDT4_GIBM7|nr:hypothetical protein FVEG_15508 [Fusarium verticillioides 7600]EWG42897.1 hypothetical protein FVEG_15508 [Fusarium verticillioides 7600]